MGIFGYKAHLILAVLTASVIQFTTSDQVILCLIGSLLPDIDHPNSMLGQFNPFAWGGLMTHRGNCHTIAGILLLSLPALALGAYWATAAGALSHLLGDWLSSLFKGYWWGIRLY